MSMRASCLSRDRLADHGAEPYRDAVSRPVLQVIIASTRPGRISEAFARWFVPLDENRDVQANDVMVSAAGAMLDDLARVTALLRPRTD
jgi:hypothetical protein